MIYYICISFAVLLFASQFAVMKFYSKSVKQSLAASLVFSMIVGIFAGIVCCLAGFAVTKISLIMGAVMAVSVLLVSVLGIAAVRLGNLSVFTTFLMLGGMLLPFIYGAAFLSESVSLWQYIGLALMIMSLGFPVLQSVRQLKKQNEGTVTTQTENTVTTQITADYANAQQQSAKPKAAKVILFYIICGVAFLANGCVGVVAKFHALSLSAVKPLNFVSIYSFFMGILSAVILIFIFAFSTKQKRLNQGIVVLSALKAKPVVLSIVYSAITSLANLLQLIAAGHVSASMQYPMVTGGTVVLTAIFALLVFKERQGKIAWCGIALTLVSTILFAF